MTLKQMNKKIENDEIRTNIGGGAFWLSSGIYLSEADALILSRTDFPFSLKETNRARTAQAEMLAARDAK